ncbi:calcium-binding protein [Pseudodonghicola flavimaris]|uniref:Calcium-binding protein n=1 Tax=Pseudodonghicola flavimaris TaxID=3050036 RepID=A0ABT7F3X4_9RHOB|nr:calcium-binding protein [Pseudodonghicola flavimaris]MDK3019314.1 calcium-binding protein [Pseudodonghicola flavimaris]
MVQTLTIDASALSGGFNSRTYISDYFAALGASGSKDFYGGEPDSAFGGTYYMNGSQIVFSYEDGAGDAVAATVIAGGDGLAYDFIHHGSSYGHGITGELDALTFGDWVEGVTGGTQGIGEDGQVTGLDTGLVIEGLGLSAEPGAGNTESNLVYTLYTALGELDADTLTDLFAGYALDMTGTVGNDRLFGGDYDDTLTGLAGNDVIRGFAGEDLILGGRGDDRLMGGKGADTLYGGAGDDELNGGAGRDMLIGGTGDDVLIGAKGVDTLTGGAGEDTFVISAVSKKDIITDFTLDEDVIDVSALDVSSVDDFTLRDTDHSVVLVADGVKIELLDFTADQINDDMFLF